VRPVVAPDHTADPASDPVVALVAGARERVLAQQLGIGTHASSPLGWSRPDPYLEALAAAARRGVAVTALVQQSFGPGDDGSRPALERLEQAGARVATFRREGVAALHNKGTIVDGAVVLGSMNANHHSRSANREVSLVLEGPGVAGYFAALFEADLAGGGAPREPGTILRDLKGIPSAPVPILLAALALVACRRC
jgi:phosphatidylserine/phosphatidylglycerophosphate/cardiolipin synthase-like enzyme